MIVKYKIEKPFGPAAAAAGGTLFVAGIVYVYFSLIGIILIVTGAFIGFTSVITYLDIEKRKVKFSNNLFGIIPAGKWIDITKDMTLGLENKHRGYRTYSRGMRTQDIHIKDKRIILYKSGKIKMGAMMKCDSLASAKKSIEELSKALGLEIK